EADHGPAAAPCERIERRRLHLDRDRALGPGRANRAPGLPKRGVRGPRRAADHRQPPPPQPVVYPPNPQQISPAEGRRCAVMIARTLVPEGAVDQYKIWWLSRTNELSRGRDADQQSTPRSEQLLRNEHSERRADRASHNAEPLPLVTEHVEHRMITR